MLAHHSFSATYDSSQKVEIEGLVKEFAWRNPHSFMRLDVADKDGTTKTWTLEWGSTNDLTQAKITRTTLKPGDRVIMDNPSCSECPDCLEGFETYCSKAPMLKQGGYRADGKSLSFSRGTEPIYGSFFQQSSFASCTIATVRNTIRVPDDAPLDILAAFPCGVNTGAGAVMNVLKPYPGDSYVAFGTGTVGFAGLLAAKLSGCDPIIAVDLFDDRLALARSLGATHTVNAKEPQLVDEVRRLAGRRGAQFCLEAAGFPEALRAAVDVLAPRGTACLVGSARAGVDVTLEMRTLQ